MKSLGLRKMFFNISGTLARQLVAVVLGLGLAVMLARTLGPVGNGTYAMTILLPTMLSLLFNLGIPSANVYYVGRGSVPLRVALRANVRLWIYLYGLGLLVALPVVGTFSGLLFPGLPKSLLWVATIMIFPIALLQSLLASLLQGIQDFRRYNIILLVAPVSALSFALVLVLFLEMGVQGAVLAFSLAQFLALLVTIWLLHPYYCNSCLEASGNYERKCVGYGWKAHLSNILTFVNYKTDIYLVNLLLNPAATGVYVIAVQIAERLWMLSQSVSTVILPRLSQLHHDEESRRLLTPIVSRWVFLVTVVGCAMLALVASPLINLLFGPKYVQAAGALLLLLPGIALSSLARVLANDLAARGRPELNMYTALLIVIINVVLNILLIPKMGISGAALATTLAYSVNAVIKVCLYAHLSGNPWWRVIKFESADWELIKGGMRFFSKTR